MSVQNEPKKIWIERGIVTAKVKYQPDDLNEASLKTAPMPEIKKQAKWESTRFGRRSDGDLKR